jgi:hypothetical protein
MVVEQGLTQRGFDAKLHIRSDVTGPLPTEMTVDAEIARVLAISRAYFRADLAVPVLLQTGDRPRRSRHTPPPDPRGWRR